MFLRLGSPIPWYLLWGFLFCLVAKIITVVTAFFPESACEGFFVKKKQPLYNTFTPSHLLIYIFTPSHLLIYIFTPSHLQIYIFTPSHLLIYILTPSHLLI